MRAFLHRISSSTRPLVTGTGRWVTVGAVALLLAALAQAPAAAKGTSHTDSTVSEWNAIAVNTIANDATKLTPETALYVAFVHAAIYDAVVGVRGRYTPYLFHQRAPRGTSAQAAAVAAAHEILVTYSPYTQAALDASYAASLAQIPDGAGKSQGIAFGLRVADNLIAARSNDGRNAPILFTQPPAPGVWRPTPPAFSAMLDPWLAFVTPLLVRTTTQFAPPPPPDLSSTRYARDFAEVKAFGSATSTARTDAQTSTALFFSGNPLIQYNAALRDQVTLRHLDIVDSARMFAAVDMSVADALITVWHAKYLYGFWRPITAINLADTDGNPATIADPSWVPLRPTPAYPEYSSGYNAFTAATSQALADVFHTHHLDLTLTSTAVPDVRHYDSGSELREDVVNARVWLGFHFRFADTASRDLGQDLARWTLRHYFRPVHDD
jgi:hypothetical protein